MSTPPINPKEYLERLEVGLSDKLFFVEHLQDVDVFLDYGCADGAMLQALSSLKPENILLGFDENTTFLAYAQRKLEDHGLKKNDNFVLSPDLDELIELLFYYQSKGLKTCIILSSVLHELKSYRKDYEYFSDLDDIFNNSDYVVVRDMGVSSDEVNDNIPDVLAKKLRVKSDYYRLTSFIRKYGDINTVGNLVHFLMKDLYKENWKNELHENYIVINDDLWQHIEDRDYEVIYSEFYTHPYIKNRTKEVFDIDLEYPTHFKYIAKRN